MQLHHLLDQIPLPSCHDLVTSTGFKIDQFHADFWKDFTLPELQKAQFELYQLFTQRYLLEGYYQEDLLTRRMATMLPLQTLFHFLSLKIDKELLSDVPQDRRALLENYQMADLSTAAEIEGLQFVNLQEFERVAQARDYIKAFNRSCGSGPLFASEKTTDVDKTLIKECPANGQFWEALLNRDSKLKKAVKIKGNLIVPDCTQQEIEENREMFIRVIDKNKKDHALWMEQKTCYLKTQAYHKNLQAWKRGGQRGVEPVRPNPMLDQDPGQEPYVHRIIELVNLAPITKAMLACGDFDSDGLMKDDASGLILSDNGYRHLDLWRHMTFMGRQMLFAKIGEMKLKQVPQRDSRYGYRTALKGVGEDYNKPVYQAWDTNRPVDPQHTNLLYASYLAKRHEKLWEKETAEGCALSIPDGSGGFLGFAWQNIERVLSQWRLAPHQILHELTNHLDLLDDASLQTVFFAFLFRHPILKNGEFELGMGQLIQTNEALFEQAKAFINKGLLHAFRTDKTLSSGRFFIEMGFYLAQYLKDAGQGAKADQLNSLQEVRHWMAKKTGLTDQDRSALHLYCVNLSSVKQQLTEEEKAHVYADWVLYQLNPPLEAKWKTPYIERSAALFMQRLTVQLNQDLQNNDFCHQLGSRLIADLELGAQPGAPWKIDAQLGLPTISSGEWKINLVTGKVSNAEGELQRVATGFPWENEDNFKHLFPGEGGFSYRSVGGKYILFTHPAKGTFRLIPPAISAAAKAGEYLIQKQVAGYKGWFDYCPPRMISDSFPDPLCCDHAYWMPEKDQLAKLALKGFITDLNRLEIAYAVRDNGEIVEADSTGLPKPNGRRVDYLQPSFKTPDALKGLSRFDSLRNIITRRNQKDRIAQIDFPRYCSLDGIRLTFTESHGRLVWGENREYALAHEAPSAMLGTVNNYLFLESIHHRKHRQGMILVPLQRIMVPQNASIAAAGCLAIENAKPFLSSQGHPSNELNGNQRYVAFKVEAGGHIVPQNDEGKLFLAYIYLSQRKEEEAVRLLQSIKPSDSLSPEAFAILDLIEQFPINVDHPDPRMVKLHALNLKIRHQQQRALEPVQEYFKEESGTQRLAGYLKDLAKVIQGTHHISSGCRFTKKEEIALLSLLATEGRAKQEKLKELLKQSYELKLKQIEARIAVLTDSEGAYALQCLYLGQRKHERHLFYVAKLVEDIPPPPAALSPPSHFTYKTKADAVRRTGSPDASYEAALAAYELKKLDHEHQLSKSLAWLNDEITSYDASQPIRYPYIKPPASWWNFKRGKLFLDVLQVAQSGREADRREMLFRLKMWKENTKNPDGCLDLMITILCFPEKFLMHIPEEFFFSRSRDRIQLQVPCVKKIGRHLSFHCLSFCRSMALRTK